VEKNFVLSGEVNVNQRQDGNGATGTTRSSLSQVSRGCNGTVKEFATFAEGSAMSGISNFSMVIMWSRSVTCLNRCREYAVEGITNLISCGYSSFSTRKLEIVVPRAVADPGSE